MSVPQCQALERVLFFACSFKAVLREHLISQLLAQIFLKGSTQNITNGRLDVGVEFVLLIRAEISLPAKKR